MAKKQVYQRTHPERLSGTSNRPFVNLARSKFPYSNFRSITAKALIDTGLATPGRWGQGLTATKMANCVWLRPELVGQFKFLEWTGGDKLRHVSFVGLREDKEARQVVKET